MLTALVVIGFVAVAALITACMALWVSIIDAEDR